jgi:hypothetical protein
MNSVGDDMDDDAYGEMSERVWDYICEVCAKETGVSPETAKAILESRGYHAYGHTGISDALEAVAEAAPSVPCESRS